METDNEFQLRKDKLIEAVIYLSERSADDPNLTNSGSGSPFSTPRASPNTHATNWAGATLRMANLYLTILLE